MTKVDGPAGLLLVPGAELMVDPVEGPMCPEFLAIGIDDVPEEPSGDPANWYAYENCIIKTFATFDDGAAYVEGFGGASILCHPSWSGLPQATVFAAARDARHRGVERLRAPGERSRRQRATSGIWPLDAGLSFAPFAHRRLALPARSTWATRGRWCGPRTARARPSVASAAGGARLRVERPRDPRRRARRRGGRGRAARRPRDVWLHGGWEEGIGRVAGPRGRLEDGAILERDDRGLITRARFTPSADAWPDKRDRRWWRLVVADERGRRAWSNVV